MLNGEIKSEQNELSAHVVNFRFKQRDLLFTPKAEITGPTDHSIIIKTKKKLKSRERTNAWLNNKKKMVLTITYLFSIMSCSICLIWQ